MMLLLDTHVWLWWLSDDIKLSPHTRNIIEEPDNQIFVSSVSAWEIIIKKACGKLNVPENLAEAAAHDGFEMLPITFAHVEILSTLPKLHNDPFDRLLICQTKIENLELVTHDKNIWQYDVRIQKA